jgi:hypothetical protein
MNTQQDCNCCAVTVIKLSRFLAVVHWKIILPEGVAMKVKYPRTWHLPWSDSNSSDDVWWKDCSGFEGHEVIVTEKLDGENTNLYREYMHARSLDTSHHPSRDWMKKFWGGIRYDIDPGYRFCGENLYAYHSILYTELPTYFFLFGIYDDRNVCFSWDHIVDYAAVLGLTTAPVLYRGIWDEKAVRELWTGKGTYPTFTANKENPQYPDDFVPTVAEGYVVRRTCEIPYESFSKMCAKYVRKNHVTTSIHWMKQAVVPNRLIGGKIF